MIDSDATRDKMTSRRWTSELKQELFMILGASSRTTLIANLCALALASVVITEGAYIVHAHYGYYMPQDAPFFLFPALVMFIIRNRKFSFFFLTLHIALAIQMFVQAQGLYYSGPVPWNGIWGPLPFLPPFFLLSLFSLIVYAVHALATSLVRWLD
jgi:hypothetical protein